MYICDICGKSYENGQKLGGHRSSHSRENKSLKLITFNINCLCCNKQITTHDKNRKYCDINCFLLNRKRIYKQNRDIKDNEFLLIGNDVIDITLKESKILRNNAKKCDICGKEKSHKLKGTQTILALDHDHKTKKFRGFLCSSCNRNLGWYENLEKNIIDYLNKK